jgi:hypothetical protein
LLSVEEGHEGYRSQIWVHRSWQTTSSRMPMRCCIGRRLWAGIGFKSAAPSQAQPRNRPLKAPADRRDPLGQKPLPAKHPYGVPVPERLQEAIAAERDNLSKVEALLSCMVVSLEYQNDPLEGPYYPAVAQLARELVARSIDGLDPFVMRQRILGDKVEEVFCVSLIDQAYPPYTPTESKVSALRLAA